MYMRIKKTIEVVLQNEALKDKYTKENMQGNPKINAEENS